MLVWFFMSAFAGIVTAYFALGGAAFVLGLWLGVCGMVMHLSLWAMGRTPHWSYAGLAFGFATTMFLIIVNDGRHSQLNVIFLIFVTLTLLSYIIYPIANHVLGASPDNRANNRKREH